METGTTPACLATRRSEWILFLRGPLVLRNGRSNVRLCRCGATPLTASPMTTRVQSCSPHKRLRVGRSAVAEGAAAELLTPVGGEPVRQIRPLRDNTRRVD